MGYLYYPFYLSMFLSKSLPLGSSRHSERVGNCTFALGADFNVWQQDDAKKWHLKRIRTTALAFGRHPHYPKA